MDPSFITRIKKALNARNLFRICLAFSATIHLSAYAAYFISTLPESGGENGESVETMEVDFEDIPPDVSPTMTSNDLFTESNPAPVEKKEWVEGTGGDDASDAEWEEESVNAVSGDGTDRDGYYFSFRGDKAPFPVIDFNLSKYFPKEAKRANITDKIVRVRVQVDADGKLKSVRVVSKKIGYGFEEAAVKVMQKVRFRPGYIAGRPTKMTHEFPIHFILE